MSLASLFHFYDLFVLKEPLKVSDLVPPSDVCKVKPECLLLFIHELSLCWHANHKTIPNNFTPRTTFVCNSLPVPQNILPLNPKYLLLKEEYHYQLYLQNLFPCVGCGFHDNNIFFKSMNNIQYQWLNRRAITSTPENKQIQSGKDEQNAYEIWADLLQWIFDLQIRFVFTSLHVIAVLFVFLYPHYLVIGKSCGKSLIHNTY